MTAKLIVVLLFVCTSSFAQLKPEPTQFDKFVNKPKIEWAAYASDTFNFKGFNTLLLNRLYKKHIKASLPVDSRTQQANNIEYVHIDSIDKAFFNGELDNNGIPKKVDTTVLSLTEVTQILYIEDGKLKSYIPWVTPTLPVYISSGKYIGERFYFNSSYNYKYNYKPRKRNKLIFLGQTKRMLKLDTAANKLKEMYGRNLLQTLWAGIQKNKATVYTIDGKQIDPKAIDVNQGYTQPQPIPIWDSTGGYNKWITTRDETYSGNYTHLQFVQDWYYDHKKNILLSYIREMYVHVTQNINSDKKILPVLKLVFK